MIKVFVTTNIARPTSDVFSFISNFANNAKWQGGIMEAYFTTDPPVRVGSEYTQVARFLGRNIESTFRVIDYEPGRLIKATTIKSTFPITFTRIVEAGENGSSITAIVEGDASGVFKLAESIIAKKVKSSIEKDYAQLKQILED
jgi:hypothetical protein